ncbi:MAG: hypothetical protein GY750_09660 [Lentisphaerae bacterium]|nr:hypothetical protein [Lentisphaerota bacterium]
MVKEKWVKVGQINSGQINLYLISNYKEVGQVGQNHLTHFSDFNSLFGGDLNVIGQSGSGISERESGKKSISV